MRTQRDMSPLAALAVQIVMAAAGTAMLFTGPALQHALGACAFAVGFFVNFYRSTEKLRDI